MNPSHNSNNLVFVPLNFNIYQLDSKILQKSNSVKHVKVLKPLVDYTENKIKISIKKK